MNYCFAHPVPKVKKYALFMDNSLWHKKPKRFVCDETQPEYADILENVVFYYVATVFPDLNPIEQVWRIARRREYTQFFCINFHT